MEKIYNELNEIKKDIENINRSMDTKLGLIISMIEDIYDSSVEHRKVCPICENSIRAYEPFGVPPARIRPNARCPVCGGLERHRLLWMFIKRYTDLLNNNYDGKIRLLHFAPERVLHSKLSHYEHIEYYPVDFNPQYPGIIKAVDITDISYPDNYFDFIICIHVLEHIEKDRKALSELFRVLKPNGRAIINAPVHQKLEKTFEDSTKVSPEERMKYFGQWDHVRKYGLDYVNRLKEAGFNVNVYSSDDICDAAEIEQYHFWRDDNVYYCTK